MQLHYYVPFWMAYMLVKGLDFFSGENTDPNVRWKKYFSEGFTEENYCRFMNDMKTVDPNTYWIMLILPNIAGVGAVFLTIYLIITMVG